MCRSPRPRFAQAHCSHLGSGHSCDATFPRPATRTRILTRKFILSIHPFAFLPSRNASNNAAPPARWNTSSEYLVSDLRCVPLPPNVWRRTLAPRNASRIPRFDALCPYPLPNSAREFKPIAQRHFARLVVMPLSSSGALVMPRMLTMICELHFPRRRGMLTALSCRHGRNFDGSRLSIQARGTSLSSSLRR